MAVRLSCAVSSIPSTLANITWFKGGHSLSVEDHGEALEFEKVARGDAGIYSCRVETLRASKSSNLVALSVLRKHPWLSPLCSQCSHARLLV